MIVGTTYLLRGDPVTVLARWNGPKGTPRNVLVELADGTRTVRPFRGLRRLAAPATRDMSRSSTDATNG